MPDLALEAVETVLTFGLENSLWTHVICTNAVISLYTLISLLWSFSCQAAFILKTRAKLQEECVLSEPAQGQWDYVWDKHKGSLRRQLKSNSAFCFCLFCWGKSIKQEFYKLHANYIFVVCTIYWPVWEVNRALSPGSPYCQALF